jgi:hypothetical protein
MTDVNISNMCMHPTHPAHIWQFILYVGTLPAMAGHTPRTPAMQYTDTAAASWHTAACYRST